MIDRIALLLLIIGGINWGLVGIFQFDLVAFLFGGAAAILSRIIYVLVAISAIWCISLFFKDNRLVTEQYSPAGHDGRRGSLFQRAAFYHGFACCIF